MYIAKKTALAAALALSMGAGVAHAVTTTGNNFTMIDPAGGIVGGTNDVTMTWDGTTNTSSNGTNFNMSLSSPYPFFGYVWTAHHIRVFGPGTYTINTACTTAQLEAGTCAPNTTASKNYTFTVGAGQLGAHMLFNWSVSTDIDVIQVWQPGVFGPSPMYTGPAGSNSPSTIWDLMSLDTETDANLFNGSAMKDGPFVGFSANFNLMTTETVVPVPAAVWLFGSGLLGLVGIARRKKKA